ncbi:MAG: hypothetical protein KBA66_00775 [Leptospiraceae bacterium]|nr:hypothetical protein [Leptospiraceae bacterium]
MIPNFYSQLGVSRYKDKAPLLIVMSDPNDRKNSQNGFYLVIPKDME